MIAKKSNKRAQEEMIGFALIIILVAVILLVFLGISLNKSKESNVESYEAESFMQAFLQYTTDCGDGSDYFSMQDLIVECDTYDSECSDSRRTCDVLNSTAKNILEQSWQVGEDTYVQGYLFSINSESENLISIEKGNQTKNYRTPVQDFSIKGKLIEIMLKIYY